MKLFYITSSFPYGNGESFLLPEIDSIYLTNIKITIIPLFPRGDLRKDWLPFSSKIDVYHEKLFSIKIGYLLLKYIAKNPVKFINHISLLKTKNIKVCIKNALIIPKSFWLKELIKKLKPDHIHAHWGSTTSTATMLATFDNNVPWSITCHRWDIYENNLLAPKSKISKFIRFISIKGKLDAIKNGVLAEKSIVIPMGTQIPINPIYPKWTNDGSEFVVLCPANLIPVKGHIYLIDALHKLTKENYNIRLLLAGEGNLRDELAERIREKKLAHRVSFLGQVTHDKLLNFYKDGNISLMVLPSIDLGNGEHEGIPVSLMEAMSYGVPVLSTNTGSINELLPEQYGLTVSQKNSEEIALWIKKIYNEPKKYLEISIICRELIEKNWDVRKSVAKLVNEIET